MAAPLIHFVHGKESGPWGGKIKALAEVGRRLGCQVESLDYSFTQDPEERLARLLGACVSRTGELLLVGSSMGGWVAAEACTRLDAKGLFLLAPALHMPGYPTQDPAVSGRHVEIVHGWNDAVIPYENSIRFAREHQCTLHLVESDHRLNDCIPLLCGWFESFLQRLLQAH
ncbi:YqiA/YcfP family alpha/beta fold hydrolase [Noviherbaspirillum pedocola]|uniref:Alpha/beta hydrolase n=1 Tax=Noviherbaspirillum pedocola TaxID=2801341 RepID=A0A934SYY3_9BURK|nr:alpha/beta fold hydrolase [Noviherbaspirillum pedocola]MBK4735239.1 alpha/beta hydrolase [Noviherbaspirillum pedocola]